MTTQGHPLSVNWPPVVRDIVSGFSLGHKGTCSLIGQVNDRLARTIVSSSGSITLQTQLDCDHGVLDAYIWVTFTFDGGVCVVTNIGCQTI
jgi:hypothetical protein